VSRSDAERLRDAQFHLEILDSHMQKAGLDDQTVADAVCLRLASAIECVADLSPELRAQAFGEDWPLIWATRNRIAHGYATIDLSIIKATVKDDLPGFRTAIAEALAAS
jgi:uncharacterized protein with HEPN domain